MEDRYNFRLSPNSWGKIASPWFIYKQVDETDAQECSVCWDKCTSYLHCSNSEQHIVCKDCSKQIIENTVFVNPDASIDIKWKCPLCRYDNELGSWQFLPSTEQVNAKEASTDLAQQQAQQQLAQQQLAQQQLAQQQLAQQQAQALTQERELQARQVQLQQERLRERWERPPRTPPRQAIEYRLSRIDENAPSKFKWVLSLDWKNSIVNHFKAWIMYTSSNYIENIHNRPPSGAELTALKQEYHYEDRKRSSQAPWFNFLDRTTP